MTDSASVRVTPDGGGVAAHAGASGPETDVMALIAGIGAGETRALGVFYEERFDQGFELARRLTRRDESFCMDVVQEAMMKVIRKLRPSLGITSRRSLDAWFARVVHTTAIDLLRREARRRRSEGRLREAPGGGVSADRESELEERIRWLTGEVRRLDMEEASLVRMRFAGERSLEAVGTEHAMTAGAVHGRLRRLLGKLRMAGKERFDE